MRFLGIVCYDGPVVRMEAQREDTMSEDLKGKQTQFEDLGAATPAFHLPDAASIVQGAMAEALESCGQKLNLASPAISLEKVRQGDRRAVDYMHYRLAQLVAAGLGELDDNVRSVSVFEFEATADDSILGDHSESLPIHLLVQVDRKTSALNALVAALDRALIQDYAEMIGPRGLAHVLDVQVVDQSDVENRRGVAALLSSLYNRPVKLWER